MYVSLFFFFKQKTAYVLRISDWSSDVCSSDLLFSQFSSAQRVGFGLALCVVATFLARLSLRFAVAGPWYGFAVTLFVAAAFMSLGFSAWPDKLPAEDRKSVV